MSQNPTPFGGGESVSPNDERLRNQGILIVTRLLAAVRTGRAYQVGNQVFCCAHCANHDNGSAEVRDRA